VRSYDWVSNSYLVKPVDFRRFRGGQRGIYSSRMYAGTQTKRLKSTGSPGSC